VATGAIGWVAEIEGAEVSIFTVFVGRVALTVRGIASYDVAVVAILALKSLIIAAGCLVAAIFCAEVVVIAGEFFG